MSTYNDKTNITYLFTYSPAGITLNPTYTYMCQINDYFWAWHKCMERFEVNSEFNKNGNLHYHGYFILKDKYRWYKIILPKMKYHGFIKINKVENDLEKAMVYCRKDRELMSKIIEHDIPFTELSHQKHIPISLNDNTNILPDYGFTL